MNFIKIYHFYLKMKIESVEKIIANLHDKKEYVIHIKNLKQTLNHRFAFENVLREIKFNQNAWLKRDNDLNPNKKKKLKNAFKNFKLIIMRFLRKLW